MNREPLAAAVELLTLGMTTVAAFLTLLVGVTLLMSRIVRRFEPPAAPPSAQPPPAQPGLPDAETRRAIEIALQRYRRGR